MNKIEKLKQSLLDLGFIEEPENVYSLPYKSSYDTRPTERSIEVDLNNNIFSYIAKDDRITDPFKKGFKILEDNGLTIEKVLSRINITLSEE